LLDKRKLQPVQKFVMPLEKIPTIQPNTPAHIADVCRKSAEARLQARSNDALRLAAEAIQALTRVSDKEQQSPEYSSLRHLVNREAALVQAENTAEYAQALGYAIEALRATASDDYQWRGFALNVIGDIFVRAGMAEKGLQYCLLALPMRIQAGDEMSLCWSLINCAEAYCALGNTECAFEYAHTARKYTLAGDMTYPETAVSTLLGRLHLLDSEQPSASADTFAHASFAWGGNHWV
jgi:tetratricopeptide (TPR) repeat protein